MKKTLLKHCIKQVPKSQHDKNMLVVGREMFDRRTPKRDVPMYKVSDGKIIK